MWNLEKLVNKNFTTYVINIILDLYFIIGQNNPNNYVKNVCCSHLTVFKVLKKG